MGFCAVDMDCRRYADEQGDEAARDEAIEARAAELMKPGAEYDPLNARNFDEAIGETLAAQNSTFAAEMSTLLAACKDAEFVSLVRKTARDYMKRLAMIAAETQLDEEYEQSKADFYIDAMEWSEA